MLECLGIGALCVFGVPGVLGVLSAPGVSE